MGIFQERLRTVRKSKHLTQEEVAKGLEISYRSYRRYEAGETEPNLSILVQIANYYDVSLDYLTGRTDE